MKSVSEFTSCPAKTTIRNALDNFNIRQDVLNWRSKITVSAIDWQTLLPIKSVPVIPCTDNTEEEMVLFAPATARVPCILVPRCRAPFGQHQESRPLAPQRSNDWALA